MKYTKAGKKKTKQVSLEDSIIFQLLQLLKTGLTQFNTIGSSLLLSPPTP
jgi:hypothetical protein